ncbi:MAG: tRNA (N6-isopentenyl adenosine(37)-C2)-methylthiotransferase MiaB [Magnetococcales bacterium]|nr:tRNA (N6-isopentenyl adenosine(37)-C2)-methylthiotransferase MiaB [Magnetococcales bacterium]
MKNLYIKNYGCQMNAYDAGRMVDLLQQSHTLSMVETPQQADLIILNTCHIREKADDKIFSELGRLKKLTNRHDPKKRYIFGVGGCVGQAQGAELFKRAPFVDLVFGPQNYHHLPHMLDQVLQGKRQLHDIEIPTESKFDALPSAPNSGYSAAVPVQEGCDRFCTYCVVPFTRGREWSRPVEDIIQEVQNLTDKGAMEIELLGQNVNAYLGYDQEGVEHDLALLIRQVSLVPGVERIRFITSHPADMNNDLIAAFAEVPELNSYMHLPIQSGSDKILAAMERGHTVAEYLTWIEKLKRVCPKITLASDFIVGFPGETEEKFEELLSFIKETKFEKLGAFIYSSEEGTDAYDMPDKVSEMLKKKRFEKLMMAQQNISLEKQQQFIGKVLRVMIDEKKKTQKDCYIGRSEYDFHEVDGVVHVNSEKELSPGDFVDVKITDAYEYDLSGIVISD